MRPEGAMPWRRRLAVIAVLALALLALVALNFDPGSEPLGGVERDPAPAKARPPSRPQPEREASPQAAAETVPEPGSAPAAGPQSTLEASLAGIWVLDHVATARRVSEQTQEMIEGAEELAEELQAASVEALAGVRVRLNLSAGGDYSIELQMDPLDPSEKTAHKGRWSVVDATVRLLRVHDTADESPEPEVLVVQDNKLLTDDFADLELVLTRE